METLSDSCQKIEKNAGSESIGDYTLEITIGEGTFGKVFRGVHNLTGEKVAMKFLEKKIMIEKSDIERVATEIAVLKNLLHPNIVRLYEVIETEKEFCLVTEYQSNGELFDHVVSKTRLEEKEACRLFQQLISAIEYIHTRKITHRNITLENILLDSHNNLKLADFSLSTPYTAGKRLFLACGSPMYAAPEMVAGKDYSGLQVDIFYCGIILFAMLNGHLPFEDSNTKNLYQKIMKCEYSLSHHISEPAQALIKGILKSDPEKRLTLDEIKTHPWFSLLPYKPRTGIQVGIEKVPFHEEIFKEMKEYGFSKEETKKIVEENRNNSVSTTYFLVSQKLLREGKISPEFLYDKQARDVKEVLFSLGVTSKSHSEYSSGDPILPSKLLFEEEKKSKKDK